MDLRRLPKVELHLHADCSLSYDAVRRLVPGISRAEYERDFVAPMPCQNLKEFLDRSERGVNLLQTEDALRLMIEDVFAQLERDGLIYAELRFAPLLHLQKGLTPARVVEVAERATDDMIRTTGVEARLILCTLRHYRAEQSMQTAQLVNQFRGSKVAALDVAGDEAGYSLEEHLAAFRFATENGLHKTAHAGEASGPRSVWDALEKLRPTRIGHGVRSIEDANLVEHLRDQAIHLEVCPSSNVQIVESIARWEEHPIDQLYRAGVPLNVNCDCRMLTPTTLEREYQHLTQVFGWSATDLLETNLAAVRAAFCDEATKAALAQRLRAAYPQAAAAN